MQMMSRNESASFSIKIPILCYLNSSLIICIRMVIDVFIKQPAPPEPPPLVMDIAIHRGLLTGPKMG